MSEKIYTIEEIKFILINVLKNMPVYSVVLFGSYAKNCATENSDLDLIIDTKDTLKGFKLYSLITKIEEAFNKNVAMEYTKGYTFETFCNDDKTIDATVFAISQIGELVKNISNETMNKYNNIEWNMIKGLRNRIVHDYEGISLKSIWYVVSNDIIELKENIETILEKEKNIE